MNICRLCESNFRAPIHLMNKKPQIITAAILLCCVLPIKSEVVVSATLLEKSELPSEEELGVYLDGLVNYLYEVKQVHEGEMESERILVSHYGIYDDVEQEVVDWKEGETVKLKLLPFDKASGIQELYVSDRWDLDFELLRYFQTDQRLRRNLPPDSRFDYGDKAKSQKIATLVGLRNQLRAVAVGDSLVARGIASGVLYPAESHFTALAHNAGVYATRMPWMRFLSHEYLATGMPDMETVILGVNPRIFLEDYFKPGIGGEAFGSTGHLKDQELAEKGWPMVWERVPSSGERLLPNGYETRIPGGVGQLEKKPTDQRTLRENVGERLRKAYGPDFELEEDSFVISEEAQKAFEEMLSELENDGIEVLAFIPPMNPMIAEFGEILDEYGTTGDGYDQIVSYLEGLEERFDNFDFEDTNNQLEHFLAWNHFRDTEHLTDLGAAMLTAHLENLRSKGTPPEITVDVEGSSAVLATDAQNALWYIADKEMQVRQGSEVEIKFDRPGNYWVGLSGKTEDGPKGFNWCEFTISLDAFDSPVGKVHDEVVPEIRVHESRGDSRKLFFDATASEDTIMAVWDFGDGTRKSGMFIEHTYSEPGIYDIELSAYGEHGLREVKAINISIE